MPLFIYSRVSCGNDCYCIFFACKGFRRNRFNEFKDFIFSDIGCNMGTFIASDITIASMPITYNSNTDTIIIVVYAIVLTRLLRGKMT